MMRCPTSEADQLAWWRAAVADPATPRHDGEPQCGWYKRRMVKGGPFVPVQITLVQEIDPDTGELEADEVLAATVNGRNANPVNIWTYLKPISRAEYDALNESHQSIELMAATHVPVDLAVTPILPGGR